MIENTEKWVVQSTQSYRTKTHLPIDGSTIDIKSQTIRTLLADGTIIARNPDKEKKGEIKMPIILVGEIFKNERNEIGQLVEKRFPRQEYLVPKKGKEEKDFSPEDWRMLFRNRAIVEFLKTHTQISYKDIRGVQLNHNFNQGSGYYFTLENLDAVENEKAKFEERSNALVGQLIEIKQNPEDFKNLAYGMGINPDGMNLNELFNFMNKLIISTDLDKDGKQQIDLFEAFLSDNDKWYRIVINKALRTKRPGSDETFIVDDGFNNFYVNGVSVAHSKVSLIGYFKENTEIFDGIENQLGLKKKDSNGEDGVKLKSPGRPKKEIVQ